MDRTQSTSPLPAALIVVLAGLACRVALSSVVPLLEAEAYYWTWSRNLAWGYFDHPPAIAVLIRATTAVVGDGTFGIRLGPLILGTAGSLLLFDLFRKLVDDRTALWSLGAATFAPFWMPLGLLAIPDAPLLFTWTLALWQFHRTWRNPGLAGWLLCGVAVGLTILSKYNGFQLPGVFLVFLLMSERGRRLLRTPGPWLAVAVALAVAAPNLAWNAAHGGSTSSRPFKDGYDPAQTGVNVLQFAGLPLLVLTPLLGVAWAWALGRGIRSGRWRGDERFAFGAAACGVPFAAFGVVALVTQVHAQWVATCFVLALPVALEHLFTDGGSPGARFLRAALWVQGATIALLVALGFLAAGLGERAPAVGRADLGAVAREVGGWDELRDRIRTEVDALAASDGGRPFVATRSFHLLGRIEWMLDGELEGLPLEEDQQNQYAHMRDPAAFRGRDAVFVDKGLRAHAGRHLRELFENVKRLDDVTVPTPDGESSRFVLFLCKGFHGRLDTEDDD